MLQFAILGHGTVGSGVAQVFFQNRADYEKKLGQPLDLKYVLDLREFPGLPYSDRFTRDFSRIVGDPEVAVVAEMMGGLHPALEYTEACLAAGKSVVTSNKELVAMKGAELLKLAEEHHVSFLFEASVGGGIPVIQPIFQSLAANRISEVYGILNGTTNFILTRMIEQKMSFKDALAEAQSLGYAEKDPSADVDGLDAARKICILASLAFGSHVYPAYVHTEGIRNVTLEDIAFASEAGYAVKLIGRAARLEGDRLSVMVSPALVPASHLLSKVSDVFNAILVRGDAVGDVLFYGRGAGKCPTASAVLGDILTVLRDPSAGRAIFWEDTGKNPVEDWRDTFCGYLLRVEAEDIPAALNRVRELLGDGREITVENQRAGLGCLMLDKISESELMRVTALLHSENIKISGAIRVLNF